MDGRFSEVATFGDLVRAQPELRTARDEPDLALTGVSTNAAANNSAKSLFMLPPKPKCQESGDFPFCDRGECIRLWAAENAELEGTSEPRVAVPSHPPTGTLSKITGTWQGYCLGLENWHWGGS